MPGSYTPPVVAGGGGGGGGGGIAGVAAVKNDGTDAPPGSVETTIPFVANTDGTYEGVDPAVATLADGALTVVNDGVVFFGGDFGPNNAAPLADAQFAIQRNGSPMWSSYTLPSGEWDAQLTIKFAKVAVGDVITAVVLNNDPEGTDPNNFYFVLTLAFAG